MFLFLGKLFAKLENTKIYSVDFFPVKICKITKEKRCNLWSDEKLKEFNASKKRYFYDFKVHIVVTTDKKPVCVSISEGSIHDVTAAYHFFTVYT